MIQTGPIEGVIQGQHALDLVGPDHGGQDIAHLQRRPAGPLGLAAEPIGNGQDRPQIVRRMPPFGRQPGIVVIQPADHGSDAKGRLDRIEFVAGAGDACSALENLRREQRGPEASCTAETPAPKARNRDCPSTTAARCRRPLPKGRRRRTRTRQFARARRPAVGRGGSRGMDRRLATNWY